MLLRRHHSVELETLDMGVTASVVYSDLVSKRDLTLVRADDQFWSFLTEMST
jgi:hypothetical protein